LFINIIFIEALKQMPKYVKDILSNKRKLEEYGIVMLIEECTAIMQNKLHQSLKEFNYSLHN
jgi:hypothetical protein